MGRSHDQPNRPSGGETKGRAPNHSGRAAAPALSQSGRRRQGERGLSGKRPIIRFVSIFIACMCLFYVIRTRPFVEERIFSPYLGVNASVSALLLRGMGQKVRVDGKEIKSAKGSLDIKHGCDAIEPSAIFMSAVLASPVAFRRRLVGIIVGTAILLGVNLIRIVSLYFVLVYWPSIFDIMHVDVWQAAFIFLAVFLWIIWARRAKRLELAATHAPTPSK